jgi:hypothetical protein
VIRQVLLGVALPATVALVAMLVAWRPWSRRDRDGRWGGAVAFTLAFLASFVAEAGWPSLPPAERWHRLAFLVLGAGVVGVLVACARRRGVARVAGAALAGAIAGWLADLPGVDTTTWRVGMGVVTATLVLALDPLAKRRRGVALPVSLVVVFATLAMLLMESHNAKLAVVAGALSASAGGVAVLALLDDRVTLAGGGVVVAMTALAALGLAGRAYDYADLPVACLALPVAAPLVLWVGEARIVDRRPGWLAAALRVAIVLVPCAIAVGLVLLGREDAGGAGDYGDYSGY